MIEKLKYHLSEALHLRRMRIRLVAALTAITIAVITLLGCSIKTVLVSDGEKTYTVHSLNGSINLALSSADLKSDNYKIVDTSVKNGKTTVKIEYTFPVYITIGDKTEKINITACTVSEALKIAGYTVDEYDLVEPAAETKISKTIYIDYTNIDYISGSYTEPIPYQTETVYSDEYEKNTVKTEDGTNGTQLVSYVSKLVNGNVVEKNITSTSVVIDAVNAKQVIGTETKSAVITSEDIESISTLSPSSPIELDESGNPVNYKSCFTARATGYTYTGHNTATGVAPQPGYIAVNPNVIPYGTEMYIKSADGKYIYGYAVAADTGGFIKWAPNGVDLFFSSKSACISFGVRDVEIFIIE